MQKLDTTSSGRKDANAGKLYTLNEENLKLTRKSFDPADLANLINEQPETFTMPAIENGIRE